MLIPKNISPDNCVYLNAAYVLQSLFDNKVQTVSELFCNVRGNRKMTFSMFVLCIDWLYLIDCITLEDGVVVLCS